MESLNDPKYNEGPGDVVPDRYGRNAYYLVVVGGIYGKMTPSSGGWADSRSGKKATIAEINAAIRRVK